MEQTEVLESKVLEPKVLEPKVLGKVRFTGDGGYTFEQEHAKKLLVVGRAYEVVKVDVGTCSSDYILKGYPCNFNTCLFEEHEMLEQAFKDWRKAHFNLV